MKSLKLAVALLCLTTPACVAERHMPRQMSAKERATQDRKLIAAIKQRILQVADDPSSVLFRRGTINDRGIVCLEWNARNRHGAYSRFPVAVLDSQRNEFFRTAELGTAVCKMANPRRFDLAEGRREGER